MPCGGTAAAWRCSGRVSGGGVSPGERAVVPARSWGSRPGGARCGAAAAAATPRPPASSQGLCRPNRRVCLPLHVTKSLRVVWVEFERQECHDIRMARRWLWGSVLAAHLLLAVLQLPHQADSNAQKLLHTALQPYRDETHGLTAASWLGWHGERGRRRGADWRLTHPPPHHCHSSVMHVTAPPTHATSC